MILSYGMVWYGMLCTVVYYLSYVFDGISVVTIRLIFQFECHYSIAWLGFFVAIAFLFSELFASPVLVSSSPLHYYGWGGGNQTLP